MKAAFFDVDETLICLKSMVSFQENYYASPDVQERADKEPFPSFEDFMAYFRKLSATVPREDLNRAYYRAFAGRCVTLVTDRCQHWFRTRSQAPDGAFWYAAGVAELQRCQRAGYRIVLVSGSFEELLQPIADALGADAIIATHLLRENGVFTGEIAGTPCIGDGKAQRVDHYAAQQGIDLGQSLAVGDHHSDIPMLATTGRALYVPGNPELEDAARAANWQPLLTSVEGPQPCAVNL